MPWFVPDTGSVPFPVGEQQVATHSSEIYLFLVKHLSVAMIKPDGSTGSDELRADTTKAGHTMLPFEHSRLPTGYER